MTKLGNLAMKTESGFQILAGSASFMFPAMAVGEEYFFLSFCLSFSSFSSFFLSFFLELVS